MRWNICYVGEDNDFRRRLDWGLGGEGAGWDVYQRDFAKVRSAPDVVVGAHLVIVDLIRYAPPEGRSSRPKLISDEELWAVVRNILRQGLRVAVLVTDYPTREFLEKALREGADSVVWRGFNAKQLGYWAQQILSLMSAWPVGL